MNWENQKGLSLVEVMVSIGILLLAVTFFSNVIISGIKTANLNKGRLELISITSSVVEEIKGNKVHWKSEGLEKWLKGQGWIDEGNGQYTKSLTKDNKEYHITITLEEIIDDGLLQITVITDSDGLTPMEIITRIRR
ncbi:prepilin-type N-terminal cleavage/methylation domain-containing protein [Anaerobranca californiensis DSM 14826]|jgi:prepilin-type N-terminal cleavage/methylation domain-containing protein|uniref:Prepilin-type N-terminal cleavage/methylation domain-containing protein n=1 Tax=Anaerobranca californiensis DSM 14826 TaxID=1120989 RepID=A0A1M6LK06_9FIRM|nr:prepilin-type N-terminal cleavage/methylation domain-containing protein [Anaerobranca californiensis]SHJ71513.1 prepilin-type N-terminal cleavage/methylation domain-containing protein [Anaerobranca californiensis DSM 14826]